MFTPRHRKRRAEVLDSDSERVGFVLEPESVMGTTYSIWDVLELGFFSRGVRGLI